MTTKKDEATETVDTTKPIQYESIKTIIEKLSKPVAARHLSNKPKGRSNTDKIYYISWYNAIKYLDYHAPGWFYEVRHIDSIGGKLIMTVRLTIQSAEGLIFREATGQENEETNSFGDSSSNAESMALRRACAKFGLGAYLYETDGYKKSTEKPNPPKVNETAPKQENAPKSQANAKQTATETQANGETVSRETLDHLISICEQPPKRKKPCDKNEVAKHYSNKRTDMLEDLLESEAMAAIKVIENLTDK